MKVILVTGGTGLVGKAIQKLSSFYEYKFIFLGSKDCDLTNYTDTLNFFNFIKPNYVIHLAACVGGLFKNMNNKVEMLEKNLLINYNVIKCCYECNVEKCLSCLSTCIFPDKTKYPINENMLHDGPPHNSNDAYAYAKRMLEIHCKAYRENFNKDFICVIPTNIYGEYDNFNLEDSHVIPGLIHKCYLSKKNNEKFIVRGSGSPLRQFIHSYDLANLILKVLFSKEKISNLILSVPEEDEVSIEKVGKLIAKSFDYEHSIEFDKSYSDGQYKKTADNSLMKELFGEYKFIKIEDGIKSTVDWFLNNYESGNIRL